MMQHESYLFKSSCQCRRIEFDIIRSKMARPFEVIALDMTSLIVNDDDNRDRRDAGFSRPVPGRDGTGFHDCPVSPADRYFMLY
jgi:hypothetical protein